jgi:hypothetical protein
VSDNTRLARPSTQIPAEDSRHRVDSKQKDASLAQGVRKQSEGVELTVRRLDHAKLVSREENKLFSGTRRTGNLVAAGDASDGDVTSAEKS